MGSLVFANSLCARLRLWEFADQYVLEPLEGGHAQLLAIRREGAELQLLSELPADMPVRTLAVFGFLGVIRLLSEAYALVVTSREHVGSYHGSSVYKVLSMKFLQCKSDSRLLSATEKADEAHLRSLLKSVEATPGLYMSYEADLTRSIQKSMSMKRDQPLWKQVDPRFVWNKQLLQDAVESQLDLFALPVIQGSFETIESQVQRAHVKVSLIARRCVRRIGTRMWRRGANYDGDVANFVETEQVLEVNGHVASYIQVRGSIPVLWKQVVDLTYKPKIELSNLDDTPKVVQKHFQDLVQRYGAVVAVDLVNQHGSEGILSMAYGNAMQNIANENIHYVPFDFHRVCGPVRFDRLSSLYEQISDQLSKQGYFLMRKSGDKIEEQTGVVRTNCIDCLDRTNVTQSLLGRKALETQLRRLGIFGESETINEHPDFDDKFKGLWANHGDNISIQYSGTPALKGDFVRHGKRTIPGILKDGHSALARYYYNNLNDGKRQDALDLAAGHYNVSRGFSFRQERKGVEIFAHLPLVSAMVIIGMAFTTVSLRQARQSTFQLFYSLIWASLTGGLMMLVRSKGRLFTSRPHLCNLF